MKILRVVVRVFLHIDYHERCGNLCTVILQIDCTAWLVCVDHDGEGVMRVVTRMAEMHARTTLGSEEALKLLQRLG